jgi:hypothetical protein
MLHGNAVDLGNYAVLRLSSVLPEFGPEKIGFSMNTMIQLHYSIHIFGLASHTSGQGYIIVHGILQPQQVTRCLQDKKVYSPCIYYAYYVYYVYYAHCAYYS